MANDDKVRWVSLVVWCWCWWGVVSGWVLSSVRRRIMRRSSRWLWGSLQGSSPGVLVCHQHYYNPACGCCCCCFFVCCCLSGHSILILAIIILFTATILITSPLTTMRLFGYQPQQEPHHFIITWWEWVFLTTPPKQLDWEWMLRSTLLEFEFNWESAILMWEYTLLLVFHTVNGCQCQQQHSTLLTRMSMGGVLDHQNEFEWE